MSVQQPELAAELASRLHPVRYRAGLDGLRAVAVLAVMVFHLHREWLPGGFVGVDIFFVISGYLITSILIREYEHHSFSLWKFYQRRIARLFPAFFTVALATLLAARFIYLGDDLASTGANLVAAALSLTNMKYLMQGSYFKISPDAQPFLHYWSLSVEEQFYLFFPVTLALLYSRANHFRTLILGVFCGMSLLLCIALTAVKPDWAFYILPTRAWELLAGAILADYSAHRVAAASSKRRWISGVGLLLVGASLIAVREGPAFPGFQAIVPVMGTVLFIGSGPGGGWAERLLSTTPAVFIGRMSYSLYLWHWPIFSFIDYRLYLASPSLRMGLKAGLTLAAAGLCFFLIESPGRIFLNRPANRRVAFAFLACALAVCLPLGNYVRKTYYVDAVGKNISAGGIAFNPGASRGSLVLMGDSNGSMYGALVMDLAHELRLKTNVISVHAGDSLPRASGSPQLWLDSLGFVRRTHPDFVILVCNWEQSLKVENDRLAIAVDELKRQTRWLIILTQPPQMPPAAERDSMRNGSRPPFREDPTERAARLKANAFVRGFERENVIVIDVEPLFIADDGDLRFAAPDGKLFYSDPDHLSDVGAYQVRGAMLSAIEPRLH